MAEITVDVGVRLNVLQNSIADLEKILNKNLTPDTSGFKALQKIITNMRSEAEKLQIQMSKGFNSQRQFNQADKTVGKLEESLEKAKLTIDKIKFSDLKLDGNQITQLEGFNDQLNNIKQQFNDFKNDLKAQFLSNDFNKAFVESINPNLINKSFDEIVKNVQGKVDSLGKALASASTNLNDLKRSSEIGKKIDAIPKEGVVSEAGLGDAYNKFFQVNSKGIFSYKTGGGLKKGEIQQQFLDYLKSEFSLTPDQIDQLINLSAKDIRAKLQDPNFFDPQRLAADKANKRLPQAGTDFTAASQNYENAAAVVSRLTPLLEALSATDLTLSERQKLVNQAMSEFINQCEEGARNSLLSNNTFSGISAQLNSFKDQLSQVNAQWLKLQSQQQTFNSMKMAITNFMGFNQVLNLTKRAVNDAMNHIKQLDTTMAGISIVTDMSTADLWKQVDAYSALAQKFGTTIQGAYDISKIYYQQGLETKDVMTLTEETLKLSKVSGLDYAKSTDYMTTALRGFKMEMQEAGTVVDVYSNLAANTAVSQEELAVAMSKTASSMESVGSTFEDTSAMIATMVAVTRESATNIGSAMKSIASRYGELTKDPAKLIDSEGEAMSFNKVDEALRSVGITMQTTDHQFRDFTDVIVELSEKWDTLDSTQQRYIATQFAGNRQQSRFLALVSNGDLLKENMEVAANSEDVGTLQALKAMDSIESKMNQVQVAAQQFYTTIGAENVWKTALDGIRGFIDTLNSFPKAGGIPLGAIATLLDSIGLLKTAALNALSVIAKEWKNIMEGSTSSTDAGASGEQAGQSFVTGFIRPFSVAKQAIEDLKNEAKAKQEEENLLKLQKTYSENYKPTQQVTDIESQIKAKEAELRSLQDELKKPLNKNEETQVKLEITDAEQKIATLKQQLADLYLYQGPDNNDFFKLDSVDGQIQSLKEKLEGLKSADITPEQLKNGLQEAQNEVNRLKGLLEAALKVEGTDTDKIKQLKTDLEDAEKTLRSFNATAKESKSSLANLGSAGTALNMIATAMDKSSAASRYLASGLMGVAGVLKIIDAIGQKNPYIALASGALMLANAVKTFRTAGAEELQNLNKEAERLSNDATKKQSEAKNLENSINKYNELRIKRDESAEATEEYNKAVEDLASKFPQLVSGFDEAGNAILNTVAFESELTAAREAAADAAYQAAIAEQKRAEQQLRSDTSNVTGAAGRLALNLNSGQPGEYSIHTAEKQGTDFSKAYIQMYEAAVELSQITDLASKEGIAAYTQFENAYENLKMVNKNDYEKDIYSDYFVFSKEGIFGQKNAAANVTDIFASRGNVNTAQSSLRSADTELIARWQQLENTDKKLSYLTDENGSAELITFTNNYFAARLKEAQEAQDSSVKNWEDYLAIESNKQEVENYQQAADEFWIGLSDKEKEVFAQMTTDVNKYSADDIIKRFELSGTEMEQLLLETYQKPQESLDAAIRDQIEANITDSDYVKTGQNTLSKLKNYLTVRKDFTRQEQQYFTDMEKQILNLTDKGLIANAENIEQATVKLDGALYNIRKDVSSTLSADLLDLINENGLTTIEGINKTIKKIDQREDLTSEQKDAITGPLNSIRINLLENLGLSITAATDNFIANWENDSKEIKKVTSGVELSDVQKMINQANAFELPEGMEFSLDFEDFKESGDKLVLSSQKAREYWAAYAANMNAQADAWNERLNTAMANLGIDENTSEDAILWHDFSNQDTLRDIYTVLGDQASDYLDWNEDGTFGIKEGVDTTELDKALIEGAKTTREKIAQYNKYQQWAANSITKLLAWDDGDYSSLGLDVDELKSLVKDNTLKRDDFDQRAAQEKINSGFNSLISDVLNKGFEGINLEDYEGIPAGVISQTDLSGSYTEFVKKYADWAKLTLEETNALIVQALEKETQSTIGAEDALKNVNFLKSDLAYASMDALQSLADSLHVAVETLFNPADYDEALGGYKVDMAALAANGLSEIVNSSNIVADSVKAFLDSISEGIGKGLEGKLGFAERDNLISNLGKYGMELDAADFTRTADGLKLSEQKAIELYNTLKQIDGISAQITFDALAKSLEDNNENYTNISAIAKRIADLQREIDNPDVSTARRQEYEAELAVAEEIYRVRSSTDNKSFDFMNRDLPNGMQSPIDYWNSTGEAYKAMNQAAKSGYMEIQDFYNIVNEMNNMAAVSGQTLSFMGQTLSGKAEDAAALIEAGMSALKNVDGEGVKIALGSLGVDFATGAADMTGDFDTGIKEMARSQIKMLDAAINMLEAIVAMENIDTSGDGHLDLGEIFTLDADGNVTGFTAETDKWLAQVETTCGNIEIGGKSLREALLELGKINPDKAEEMMNRLKNIDWTLGDVDVFGQIQNVLTTFFPGKIITKGKSIFEILEVPSDANKNSSAFKSWVEKTGLSVEKAENLLKELNKKDLWIERDGEFGKAIQSLLGINEKTQKLFDTFTGDHITQKEIQMWGNIGFDYDLEGKITGAVYHGSDGGILVLPTDNSGSWKSMIQRYEKALNLAQSMGGGIVESKDESNTEFKFITTVGEQQEVIVTTDGEITHFKFPNGFECDANDMQAALALYAENYRQEHPSQMNLTDQQILLKEHLLVKRTTDVTFIQNNNGKTPEEQAKEVIDTDKAKLTELIKNAAEGKDGGSKIFNNDTKKWEWVIPLPSGDKINFETDGEELTADKLIQGALETVGIDANLVEGIAQGIQSAFDGSDLGGKIAETITEAIRTSFTNVNIDSNGNELPPITVDMSGKIDANTDIQPRQARVSGCGIMTSAESEERAWELWLSMYQAQMTNNSTTENLTTTGTHTIEATTTSGINYTLNVDGDTGVITYVWSDGTTFEDQSQIETKVQEYFNQNATMTTVDGGQGNSINAVRTINGVTYLITIQKNPTDGKYIVQGFGSSGLVDNPSDWINEQISKKMDEGTAGISNQETTSLPSISRMISINGIDYIISIEKTENGMYKVNFPGWGEVSTTDPDTWINNCVTAELEKGTTGINSDASVTKEPLKGTISYNGINYDITVGENKKYLVNGAGDYTSLSEAVQSIMNNISSAEGTTEASINGGTTTITQKANVVVDAQDVSLTNELTLPSIPTLTQEVNELIIKPKNVKIDNTDNDEPVETSTPTVDPDQRFSYMKIPGGNYYNPNMPELYGQSTPIQADKVDASGSSIEAEGATVNLSENKGNKGNNNNEGAGSDTTGLNLDISSITSGGAVNVTGSPVNITGTSTGGNEGGEGTESPTLDISGITGALDSLQSALSAPTSAISLLTGAIQAIPTDKAQAVRKTAEAIDKLKSKEVTVTGKVRGVISASVDVSVSATGAPTATATVNRAIAETSTGAKGNVALAKGTNLSLATGKKQTLMGELGPELVVSNGRYYTVGNNGAEFVDLPEDAIVFNHKQTRKLLGNKGSINGRGKPVKSENAAISFATGNVTGPAMAGAAAALAALKQIRAMWQSMLDASAEDLGSRAGRGGGGGGGGGGGKDRNNAAYIHNVEIWYNLLRQIAKIEKDITKEESIQNKLLNDRKINGKDIYNSYQSELLLLEKNVEKNKQLLDLQKQAYKKQVENIMKEDSPWRYIFTATEDGLLQYNSNLSNYINKMTAGSNSYLKNGKIVIKGESVVRDAEGKAVKEKVKGKKGKKKEKTKTVHFEKELDQAISGLDLTSLLNATDQFGKALYTAEEQLEILKAYGFGEYIKYDENGQVIKGDDAAVKMVENFWNLFDNIMKETDDLYDSQLDTEQKILEQEIKANEIREKIRDNQIDVEEAVLKAITDKAQAEIDALQDERDALEKANQKFLDGLNDALQKERDLYQRSQDAQELNKLQRQLAILQRSGGSASQIRSLQDQINQKQRESYFTSQEDQINAIQEASDLQIERLDAQIDIMTETLEYQKENGLLWQSVEEVIRQGPDYVLSFIEKFDNEYKAMSATQREKEQEALGDKVTEEAARRQYDTDWNNYLSKIKSNSKYTSILNASNIAAAEKAYKEAYFSKDANGNYKSAAGGEAAATNLLNSKIPPAPAAKPSTAPVTKPATPPVQQTVKVTTAPIKSKNAPYYASVNAKSKSGNLGNKANQYFRVIKDNAGYNKHLKYRMVAIDFNGQTVYVPIKYFGKYWKVTGAPYSALAGLNIQGMKYKQGGLVDYTGPAWVDGTPNKPEAFLNAEQTASLKKGLFNTELVTASIDNLRAGWDEFKDHIINNISNNSNETITIEKAEVNMNVSQINDDYGAHRAGQEVMAEMLKIANKSGTRAITRR